MKDLIALAISILIAIAAVTLVVRKQITNKFATVLLVFSLAAGFLASNYDFVKKLKWMNLEVETFEREVATVKEKAMAEIGKEVQDQKEAIRFLISNANDARERIEKQKGDIDTLVKTSNEMVSKLNGQKQGVEDLNVKTEKLSEKLGRQIEVADKKVMKLDETARTISRAVSDTQEVLEFTTTMASAQNNDRKAFDQLEYWSKDSSHPFSQRSKQAWKAIVDSYARTMFMEHRVPWNDGVDPSKLTVETLQQQYDLQTADGMKIAFMQYIYGRNDYNKKDKMRFLAEVLQKEQSMLVYAYAGHFFNIGAGLRLAPVGNLNKQLEWWEINKQIIN